MPLPSDWRRHKGQDLELYLERGGLTDEEVDDVIEELANRDAQRAANAGAMNGVAPEYDPFNEAALQDRADFERRLP